MGLVPAIFCVQISSPRSPLGLVPFTKNRPLGLVPDVDREYKNIPLILAVFVPNDSFVSLGSQSGDIGSGASAGHFLLHDGYLVSYDQQNWVVSKYMYI